MTPPTLTPEQRAQLHIKAQMNKHTGSSIFDGRGELNHQHANDLSEGNLSMGEYLDLSMISYPPDPDGSDHAIDLSRLVTYMGKLPSGGPGGPDVGGVIGGPLSDHDTRVLHAVAVLYATGRSTPSDLFQVESGRRGYEDKSAAIADAFLRAGGGKNTYWSRQDVREEVCRLIYKHNDVDEIKSNKLLQVFDDARRYETVRYSPNTAAGMALLKARCGVDRYYLRWSADRANFRQYMLSRGWK